MVLIFLWKILNMLKIKNIWHNKYDGSKYFNKIKFKTAYKTNQKYKNLSKLISQEKLDLINEIICEVFQTTNIKIQFGLGRYGKGSIYGSRFHKFIVDYKFIIPLFYLTTTGNNVYIKNNCFMKFDEEFILPKLSIFFRKYKKFPCREQLITYFERVYNNYKNMLIDDELNLSNQTFMKSPSDDFDLSTMGFEIKN